MAHCEDYHETHSRRRDMSLNLLLMASRLLVVQTLLPGYSDEM